MKVKECCMSNAHLVDRRVEQGILNNDLNPSDHVSLEAVTAISNNEQ